MSSHSITVYFTLVFASFAVQSKLSLYLCCRHWFRRLDEDENGGLEPVVEKKIDKWNENVRQKKGNDKTYCHNSEHNWKLNKTLFAKADNFRD